MTARNLRAGRLTNMFRRTAPADLEGLALSVWLLARTSAPRGELVQRAIVGWVVTELFCPLARTLVRSSADVTPQIAELIGDVRAWARDAGVPRGVEHWSTHAAWWSKVATHPREHARIEVEVAPVADLICRAAEAVATADLHDFARFTARAAGVAVDGLPRLEIGTAAARFDRAWGDDLRALFDARADHIWAELDRLQLSGVIDSHAAGAWDAAWQVAADHELDAYALAPEWLLTFGPLDALGAFLGGYGLDMALRERARGTLLRCLRELAPNLAHSVRIARAADVNVLVVGAA